MIPYEFQGKVEVLHGHVDHVTAGLLCVRRCRIQVHIPLYTYMLVRYKNTSSGESATKEGDREMRAWGGGHTEPGES